MGLFRFSIACNDGKMVRDIVLAILDLDFERKGVDRALRFRWIADSGTKPGADVTYTYSPGGGPVDPHEIGYRLTAKSRFSRSVPSAKPPAARRNG